MEAVSPAGTVVTFDAPQASDAVSTPTVTVSAASGATFATGTSTVTATARDAAGNASSCEFRVNVLDRTPPALTCNAAVVEMTAPEGARLAAALVRATDLVSEPVVTFDPPVGTWLPPGEHVVAVKAVDGAGNASTCDLAVTVVDTTPPTLDCTHPAPIEATGPTGAPARYDGLAATDPSNVTWTYAPAAGTTLPLGTMHARATATDSRGNAASCELDLRVVDTTPPALACPPDQHLEATFLHGANATFAATASDRVSTPVLAYDPPPGPFGPSTTVTATATDAAGNAARCTFRVLVNDTTPPVATCPADLTVEARSAAGALVTLPDPAVTEVGSTFTVRADPPGFSTFPLGATPVAVTVTDEGGLTGSCTYRLNVVDTTAPALTCPRDPTVEATSASGAAVVLPAATAQELVSVAHVTTQPADGTFALGDTPVVVTAVDDASNKATCRYVVHVRDTTAPTITCPADRTLEAGGPTGAPLAFPPAAAADAVSTPSITYRPEISSNGALGDNFVTATATDAAGNAATCRFHVTVADRTPPTLSCPAEWRLEATSGAGAEAAYPNVPTEDAVGPVALVAAPAAGTVLPLGTRTATITATDGAGNTSSCAFPLVVEDTTPPTLACPPDVVAEATGPDGAAVTFAPAAAFDAVSEVTLTSPSGSTFAPGTTTVTLEARDRAGNGSTCEFHVTVVDTTPPELHCATTRTIEATSKDGAAVPDSLGNGLDAVSTVRLASEPPAGAALPLGTTSVRVTAVDEAGNAASCAVAVDVVDTTPPALTCPPPVVAEATSADGARVTLPAPEAADLVGIASVGTVPPSDTTFPLGTTSVQALARDAAGNEASCAFDVLVRDTTPPAVTCPADFTVDTATPDLPAPSVSDATAVEIRFDHAAFSAGTTPVTATARDAAGNEASCTFRVTVASGGCGCSGLGDGVPLLALAGLLALRRRRAG